MVLLKREKEREREREILQACSLPLPLPHQHNPPSLTFLPLRVYDNVGVASEGECGGVLTVLSGEAMGTLALKAVVHLIEEQRLAHPTVVALHSTTANQLHGTVLTPVTVLTHTVVVGNLWRKVLYGVSVFHGVIYVSLCVYSFF